MSRHLGLMCFWLAVPAFSLAQPPGANVAPESLLSADSLLYLRYDGLDAHRSAYEKTALAEVLRGDLGDFLSYIGQYLKEGVGPQLLRSGVLEGSPPKELLKVQSGFNQLPHLLDQLCQKGVVIGLEVPNLFRPRVQLTVVFPNGAEPKSREAIVKVLEMIALLSHSPVRETTVGERTIFQAVEGPDFHVAWWNEANHVVLSLGTEPLQRTLEVCDGRRPNLTNQPLFKSVSGFDRYETVARGYLDFELAIKAILAPSQSEDKVEMVKEIVGKRLIVGKLGLDGLKSITVHYGFQDKHLRSTIALNVVPADQRKGILRLVMPADGFDPKHLPPLPPDASTVTTISLDLGNLYDVIQQVAEAIALALDGDSREVQEFFKEIDKTLGIDLRKDLLDTLDSTAVFYNSASEGPFPFGFGLAIKVKDAAKLQESMEALLKAIPPVVGAEFQMRRRVYRGVDVHTLTISDSEFPLGPSYTIHKGWMVVGLFPQVPQGYVLRSEGKHSAWKPPALRDEFLAIAWKPGNEKSKIISVTVSDPRVTLRQLAALAPFLTGVFQAIDGGLRGGSTPPFDISRFPHSQSITEPLYPNVTVCVDDGTAIRIESQASFPLLIDLAGVDTYVILFFLVFGLGGGFLF